MTYDNITPVAGLSQVKAPTVADAVYGPDLKTNVIQPLANRIQVALDWMVLDSDSLSYPGGVLAIYNGVNEQSIVGANTTFVVKGGDKIAITVGPMSLHQSNGLGSFIVRLIEDVSVSGAPVVSKTLALADTVKRWLTYTIVYEATKTGNLALDLLVTGDGTNNTYASSLFDQWGSYVHYGPALRT
ncbi:MAG: hypothetical protein ABFD89_17745 [Bryobacteraceae bacterium]